MRLENSKRCVVCRACASLYDICLIDDERYPAVDGESFHHKIEHTSASSFSFSWTSLCSVVLVGDLVVVVVELVAILNLGLVALTAAETALAKRIPGI